VLVSASTELKLFSLKKPNFKYSRICFCQLLKQIGLIMFADWFRL
jgi:hypothetical protein